MALKKVKVIKRDERTLAPMVRGLEQLEQRQRLIDEKRAVSRRLAEIHKQLQEQS